MYIALIGDIISSKNIKDRAEAQVKLLNLMKIINKKYKDYLVSPFTVKKVGVSLEDKDLEDNINSLLLSSDFIKAKWTNLQYDILKVLLDDNIYIENFSNNIVANRLNISPSAFNKRLKASGLKIYLNNRVKANELLIKSI